MICDDIYNVDIFYLSLDNICSIHATCFLITLLLLCLFIIESLLYKIKKIEKKVTFNHIVYKVLFYIGFLSSITNIFLYVLFYIAVIYYK